MMNLLINVSSWQVPEWMTFGSSVGIISALIAMYANFKRLGAIKQDQRNNSGEQIGLLGKIVTTIVASSDKDKQITEILARQNLTIEKLEQNTELLKDKLPAVAIFVNEAFQKTGLSDVEKLELSFKLDELFDHRGLEVIGDLQDGNEQLTILLTERDKEVESLKTELETTKTKLTNVDKPVRKNRRV